MFRKFSLRPLALVYVCELSKVVVFSPRLVQWGYGLHAIARKYLFLQLNKPELQNYLAHILTHKQYSRHSVKKILQNRHRLWSGRKHWKLFSACGLRCQRIRLSLFYSEMNLGQLQGCNTFQDVAYTHRFNLRVQGPQALLGQCAFRMQWVPAASY